VTRRRLYLFSLWLPLFLTVCIMLATVFNHSASTRQLLSAIHSNNGEAAEQAIQHGADVNARSNSGATPIFNVVQNNHIDLFNLLAQAGADLKARDKHGFTLLHWVSNPDIAKALITAGADVNAQTIDGRTPLQSAALNNHIEIAKLLLNAGARSDLADREGKTALDVAMKHHNAALIDLLHNAAQNDGAATPVLPANAIPPLPMAVENNSIEAVKKLISQSADVNQSDRAGMPLHIAAGNGNTEIMALLIAAGAKINALDSNGFTPLDRAITPGHLEAVRLLAEKGADINLPSPNMNMGLTPLHLALVEGKPDIARFLIDKGANLTAIDSYGRTPLKYARIYQEPEIADLLLRKTGAKESLADSDPYRDQVAQMVDQLRHAKDQTARQPILLKLDRLGYGAKDAVPYLAGLLKNDPGPFIYNNKIIDDSDGTEALAFRQHAIKDEQAVALEVLQRIGTPEAKQAADDYMAPLRDRVAHGFASTHGNVRSAHDVFLLDNATWKEQGGIAEFRAALGDSDIVVRIAAARALLNRGDSKDAALQVLQDGLHSKDDSIQQNAMIVLKNYARKDPSVEWYLRDAAEKDDHLRSNLSGGMISPWLKSELTAMDRKNTFDPAVVDKSFAQQKTAMAVTSENDGNTGLIVNGSYWSFGNQNDKVSITSRLPSGTPNPAFGNGGVAVIDVSTLQTFKGKAARLAGVPFGVPWQAYIRSMAIDRDQSIVAGGYTNDGPFVLKLRPNGTLDLAFGHNGLLGVHASTPKGVALYGGMVSAVAITGNGKIYSLGNGLWNLTDSELRESLVLARYKANGTPDESFGRHGMVVQSPEHDINLGTEKLLLQKDGGIMIALSIPGTGFSLRRFMGSGTPDVHFGTAGEARLDAPIPAGLGGGQYGVSILSESDGKLTIAGFYETSCEAHGQKGGTHMFAQRYNANGRRDVSFGHQGSLDEVLACLMGGDTPLIAIDDEGQITAVYKHKGVQTMRWDRNGQGLPNR
jgi:uncharacterized delta-60 repeat protein